MYLSHSLIRNGGIEMCFIIKSKRLALSYTAHGAVETYQNGILVYVGDDIFPISRDTVRALSYYLGEGGDTSILPFDTLSGTVDVPSELTLEWSKDSFDVPPLCKFTLAQVGDGEGWLLCYNWDAERFVATTDYLKTVLMSNEDFAVLIQDCDSYCGFFEIKGVEVLKAWTYQGSLPTSKIILIVSQRGLDIIFPHGTVLATNGETDSDDWVRLVVYLEEMFTRPPGSFRRFVRFDKIGSSNFSRLEEGVKVEFYQSWPYADDLDAIGDYRDKHLRYVGSMTIMEDDMAALVALLNIEPDEGGLQEEIDILSQLIDEVDSDGEDEPLV